MQMSRLPIMRLASVCAILWIVATLPARNAAPADQSVAELDKNPRVQKAMAKLGTDSSATTEEQIRITEIPAPPFHEAARAAYLSKLFSAAGLEVEIDGIGNVIGKRAGAS